MVDIEKFEEFKVDQTLKLVGGLGWGGDGEDGCTRGGFNLLGTYNCKLTYETWSSDTQNCGLTKHDLDVEQGNNYCP